jgi:hypothetical protein
MGEAQVIQNWGTSAFIYNYVFNCWQQHENACVNLLFASWKIHVGTFSFQNLPTEKERNGPKSLSHSFHSLVDSELDIGYLPNTPTIP